MTPDWIEAAIVTPSAALAQRLADALTAVAHDGSVVQEQWGNPAELAPDALLSDVTVRIYQPAPAATPEWQLQVMLVTAACDVSLPVPAFRPLVNHDWSTEWKQSYRPVQVGDQFLIQPTWLPRPDVPSRLHIIEIDPGMAFGTGLHETTRLCLEALARLGHPGRSLLDLGTGTGILAIGGAKLGLDPVVAVDNDDDAVTAARENVARNGVGTSVRVRKGTLADVTGRWDLIAANILAPILVEMIVDQNLLGHLSLDGYLILSGIVREQIAEVERAVKGAGGRIVDRLIEGDWAAIVAQRE